MIEFTATVIAVVDEVRLIMSRSRRVALEPSSNSLDIRRVEFQAH